MVSTNDSSLEPSFFHLHQYPINDEEADENSNENEIKSFFLNETKSIINRPPPFRKKRFVNILTGDEVKRFRMFVTANQ